MVSPLPLCGDTRSGQGRAGESVTLFIAIYPPQRASCIMQGFLRQAVDRDSVAVRKIMRPWTEADPSVSEALDVWFRDRAPESARCTVLEVDKTLRAACLWNTDQAGQVNLLGLGAAAEAAEAGIDTRLLRELILEWVQGGTVTANVLAAPTLPASIFHCLRGCGFFFEGRSAELGPADRPSVRLRKYFLYRTIHQDELIGFLQELMTSFGYEVRREGPGFRYRAREEFRRPFLFAQWHEITVSGSDLVVHPPARILDWYELETLFYPLRICGRDERPLFLPMEKKRAEQLMDLSQHDPLQKSLFEASGECQERVLRLNNLTYSHPVGGSAIRKGLPFLFYVNKIGVVGAAKVEDAYLDEPDNVCRKLQEIGEIDSQDVHEQAATAGPRMGMVQVITYQWYQAFSKAVSLEEIRGIDPSFNPQRTRLVSSRLFDAIVARGAS